jgi:uncharacterized protein YcbK (DUF882 family)
VAEQLRIPRHRLTPHFTVEEFDSHDGALVPVADLVALEHLCEWFLEPMRREFGPCRVLSGFRSQRHNAAVGGARRSVHMLRTPLPHRGDRSSTHAAAADVQFRAGQPEEWARLARGQRRSSRHLQLAGRGGIGTYAGFVHLDTGAARDWRG